MFSKATVFLLALYLTGCRSFEPNDLMSLSLKTDEGILSETKFEIQSKNKQNISKGIQYFVEQHNKRTKRGKYVLKIQSENKNSFGPPIIAELSILTLMIPQLFGIPLIETSQVNLTGEIYYQGVPVKQYISSGKKEWSIISCWYGYSPSDARDKSETLSFKEAYDLLLSQIIKDKDLKQKAIQAKKKHDEKIAIQKALEEKKKAEQAQQKALEEKKKAEEKKKKLQKIRSNLNSTGCKDFNKTVYITNIFGSPIDSMNFGDFLTVLLYEAQEKHPQSYIKCEYDSMDAIFRDANMLIYVKTPGHRKETIYLKQEDNDIFLQPVDF